MPDRTAPVFFLSYAHTGSNQSVAKFFADLSRDVAELVALRTGADPGFMDRRTVPDLYLKHGLLGLSRIAPNAYESIVWLPVRAVANIVRNHWINPLVLRQESLRNIFRESP